SRSTMSESLHTKEQLLLRYALLSALAIAALGAVIATVLARELRNDVLASSRRQALMVQVVAAGKVTPEAMKHGVTGKPLEELDRAFAGSGVARVKIWSPDGRIVYSDDHDLIGRRFPLEDDITNAVKGKITSGVSDLRAAENVAERGHG